jgi:hypothetical protein
LQNLCYARELETSMQSKVLTLMQNSKRKS